MNNDKYYKFRIHIKGGGGKVYRVRKDSPLKTAGESMAIGLFFIAFIANMYIWLW